MGEHDAPEQDYGIQTQDVSSQTGSAPSNEPEAQPSTEQAPEAKPDENTEPRPVESDEGLSLDEDKHSSLKDRSGEGAPGDLSGVWTDGEKPSQNPGDLSHLTGRTEYDQ